MCYIYPGSKCVDMTNMPNRKKWQLTCCSWYITLMRTCVSIILYLLCLGLEVAGFFFYSFQGFLHICNLKNCTQHHNSKKKKNEIWEQRGKRKIITIAETCQRINIKTQEKVMRKKSKGKLTVSSCCNLLALWIFRSSFNFSISFSSCVFDCFSFWDITWGGHHYSFTGTWKSHKVLLYHLAVLFSCDIWECFFSIENNHTV